jgi:hypothetical protein
MHGDIPPFDFLHRLDSGPIIGQNRIAYAHNQYFPHSNHPKLFSVCLKNLLNEDTGLPA